VDTSFHIAPYPQICEAPDEEMADQVLVAVYTVCGARSMGCRSMVDA
jgi:hypothetical protein